MSDKTVSMERNLGGEVNKLFKERINADIRGFVVVEDYIQYLELVEYAKEKGVYDKLKTMFDRMERRILGEQYDRLNAQIRDDISRMSVSVGHTFRDTDKKTPFEEGMEF